MNFTLTTMGTASAMPISDRNPSAHMLAVQGRLFLIDCGEGTQKSMRLAHLSFVKIEAIFISHTHGDHLFGLFGLLNSMGMYGRTQDLDIYGPQPLGNILNFYQNYFGDEMPYKIVYHPLKSKEPELIHTSKHITVTAFPLKHKITSYGFRFDEIVTPRHAQENPDYKAKSFAYCSDTMPFPQLPDWVRGVDALYHEATYYNEHADKAVKHFHSTTSQAAKCASDAGVGKLIVGHYSSRITDFDLYIKECQEVFPNTVAAKDGDIFEI